MCPTIKYDHNAQAQREQAAIALSKRAAQRAMLAKAHANMVTRNKLIIRLAHWLVVIE